jgi:hypothetical protein
MSLNGHVHANLRPTPLLPPTSPCLSTTRLSQRRSPLILSCTSRCHLSLECCLPPRAIPQHVQSGTTANFTAVAAKVGDAGYKFFLVL